MNQVPAAGEAAPDLVMTLVKSFAMLFLVLGVLIAVLYLIRRFSGLRAGTRAGEGIRMLSSFHLSPRERVVLLDVLGDFILIGATPETITFLSRIEPREPTRSPDEPDATFDRHLSAAVSDAPDDMPDRKADTADVTPRTDA